MAIISEVFGSLLTDVKRKMRENNHQHPVDVELSFESLEIDSKGGLFVPKKSLKSELTIKLATRISPEQSTNDLVTAPTTDVTDVPSLPDATGEVLTETRIFEMAEVDNMPVFPGGNEELSKFLAEHIQYPQRARENNIQGVVTLLFVIDTDGSVQDATIFRDIGEGCGTEAIRVIQMMPKWAPAIAGGTAVKVRFALPVRFRLA